MEPQRERSAPAPTGDPRVDAAIEQLASIEDMDLAAPRGPASLAGPASRTSWAPPSSRGQGSPGPGSPAPAPGPGGQVPDATTRSRDLLLVPPSAVGRRP